MANEIGMLPPFSTPPAAEGKGRMNESGAGAETADNLRNNNIRKENSGVFMKGGEPFFILKSEEVGVMMLHGFTSSPYQLRELGNFLAGKDLTVFCPVIAGHATSPEDLMTTTIADWQRSVDEAFIEISQKVKKVFVIGNSFGGNLAFDLATRFSTIKGIVSLGTPIRLKNHAIIKLRYYTYGWMKKYYRKPGVHYHDDYVNVAENISYPVIPIKSLNNFLAFIETITLPNLGKVKTPTLIVHADKDPVVHPRSAQTLHEKLGSDYKKVCWLNGRFHTLTESERRGEIYGRIYEFIKELS